MPAGPPIMVMNLVAVIAVARMRRSWSWMWRSKRWLGHGVLLCAAGHSTGVLVVLTRKLAYNV